MIRFFIAYMAFGILAALLIVVSYDAMVYMDVGSLEGVLIHIERLGSGVVKDMYDKVLSELPTFGGFFDELFSVGIGSVFDSFFEKDTLDGLKADMFLDLVKMALAGLLCSIFGRLNKLFLNFFRAGGFFSPYNIALYTVRAYYLLASYCVSIVIIAFVQKTVVGIELQYVVYGCLLLGAILFRAFLITLKAKHRRFEFFFRSLLELVLDVIKAYFLWWTFNKFNDWFYVLFLILIYGILEAIIEELILDKAFKIVG